MIKTLTKLLSRFQLWILNFIFDGLSDDSKEELISIAQEIREREDARRLEE